MEDSPVGLHLTDYDIADIELFCEIAGMHGSFLSTREAVTLLGLEVSTEDLERTWHLNPHLDSRYALKSGIIIPKDSFDNHDLTELKTQEANRRSISQKHVSVARDFAALTGSRNVRITSVSGSVSYGSASENDDIDLFCITAKGTAWIFITRALLLARIFCQADRQRRDICLSCIMDEEYAEKLFAEKKDALFARDALNIQVITGSKYYQGLLSKHSWIAEYFPRLYPRSISSISDAEWQEQKHTPFILRTANLFLYQTAGRYIRLKAYLLNRKLAKRGWISRIFNPLLGEDHCIYESARYVQLRQLYSRLTGKIEID